MCRGQLPVWQREWPKLRSSDARFVSVAADTDLDAVRRLAGGLDFPTLVDTENELARVLRYRAIPNGYLFSLHGELVRQKVTAFDLAREPTTHGLVKAWLADSDVWSTPGRPGMEGATEGALELFAAGERLRVNGDISGSLARWHAAYLLDPASFVVRKQIWRALYPHRFGETIDLDWQRDQIAREDSLGFSAANPTLPPAEP